MEGKEGTGRERTGGRGRDGNEGYWDGKGCEGREARPSRERLLKYLGPLLSN